MSSPDRMRGGLPTQLLDRITAWAELEGAIRGLLLMGSRALRENVDGLADFDVGIFATNFAPYLGDEIWLSQFATVWVCSPYEWTFHDTMVPTRLVIYEGGTKVDFSFWNPNSVDQMAEERYFDTGYEILLDKDGALQRLGEPTFGPVGPSKPTAHEFAFLINEYWFEAYHVAKYLKREDLWLVKFRDFGSTKMYLLTMMEWYMRAKRGWSYDVKWHGKQIKQWLEPEIYDRLFDTYAHFDAMDSWSALIANNELFRDLSNRTANLLGYENPADVAENLSSFVSALRGTH